MKHAFLCIAILAAACGDNLSAPEDAGPAEPPPDATTSPEAPPAPEADGEYVIKVSPTSFSCVSSGPQPLETFYAVADIVDQDALTSDLLSELHGTFVEYDRWNLPRDESGYFLDEREDPVGFWDIILAARRRIEGSADGKTLAFSHRYDLGWYDDQETYHSECVYEADIQGVLLHERWGGTPKDGIGGQWRVTRTVEESPLDYGQDLPYVHQDVVTTLEQAPDGSMIELRGLFRGHSAWPLRDPLTGRVDAYELWIAPYVDSGGNARTMLQETVTSGWVLPESIDLEQTWRWWTAATETLPAEEHWLQRERYVGVPRYRPHDREADEPLWGTYAARYELVWNDCGYEPYAVQRIMDVLPLDDGALWPRVTGFGREPFVTPGADGAISLTFTRATAWSVDVYDLDGWLIDGHDVDLRLHIDRIDAATGTHACTALYEISGSKLYMTARP